MRWKALVGLGVVVRAVCGVGMLSASADTILFRHHFAGLSAIGERADLAVVKTLFDLAESRRLRSEAEGKLAARFPAWFGGEAAGTSDHVAASLPWVRAFLDRENYAEVTGDVGRLGSWVVAVRWDEAKAVGAGQSLREALTALYGGKTETAGNAWDWTGGKAARSPAARFAWVGGWAVLGSGKDAFEGTVDRIRKSGGPVPGPAEDVAKLEADLPKLASILGWAAQPSGPVPRWPSVRLVVEPRNGRFRTSAELSYAEPLGLQLEPWTLPTAKIRDPLVGFTAMQGADRWLGRLAMFAPYQVTEWPKQFFFWSVAGDPWNQYMAGPMSSPTNFMAKVSLPLPMSMVTNMSWRGEVFGLRITNKAMRVEFRGLPYLLPFLESIRENDTSMLFGGLFPQPVGAAPAPAELLRQVSTRTNLVLYEWETTGRSVLWTNAPGPPGPRVTTNAIGRLTQFKQLNQYWRLMMNTSTNRVALAAAGEIWTPGWDWVNAAQGYLGDTITEVTQTGPSQLKAVRSSQLGFNSMEIAYLLRWLENPGFPGWSDEPFVPAGTKSVRSPLAPGEAAKP
ncbi:MAG: hypothetical protein JNL97_13590 [Verrucomicrobiales bacterium]|nr:hypothetical protein [Verrucomicrobiales bacterium]